MNTATSRTPERLWSVCATLLVAVLGFVGGWYGRTELGDIYGSDGTAYMDCARAIARGDLVSALNPLWSQGYPALIALMRPLFGAGMEGDWRAVHVLNSVILVLGWLAFLWCVREMLRAAGQPETRWMLAAQFCAFVTTQMGIDSLAHVTPDRLVALLFFVSCGLLLRLLRGPSMGLALTLGAVLGAGFLVKSIFAPLGVAMLTIIGIALRRRAREAAYVIPAAVVFGSIVLVYGVALSRAVGRPTLGESATLNYAWHVNRLHKWVHWQGGADTAEEAWGSGTLARLARWDRDPPQYGLPLHPSLTVGSAPQIYVFHGPMHASYVPYFDPPYWYEGYRHFFRWRYQAIALVKNLWHLLQTVLYEPWFYALGLVLALGSLDRKKLAGPGSLGELRPVILVAALGILIYLPVHLEGRYVSGFLAVLCIAGLIPMAPAVTASRMRSGLTAGLLALGFVAGLVKDQRVAWARAFHGISHEQNVHWRMGEALAHAGLPPGSQIGVIFRGANLDSDWANMAQVEITSEIASGADEDAFWALPLAGQTAVLASFHAAGATAVVSRDPPRGAAIGWERLGDAPLWIFRPAANKR